MTRKEGVMFTCDNRNCDSSEMVEIGLDKDHSSATYVQPPTGWLAVTHFPKDSSNSIDTPSSIRWNTDYIIEYFCSKGCAADEFLFLIKNADFHEKHGTEIGIDPSIFENEEKNMTPKMGPLKDGFY